MKNQHWYFKFYVVAMALLPALSNAEVVGCGAHTINNIYVQGDRDDNSEHANKAIARLSAACNGSDLVYIEITHPAYKSLLSTLLTAYATGSTVNIYVNSSKTISSGGTQISILQLLK
jgi:hypothetical protein